MIHDDLIAAGITLTPEQAKARKKARNATGRYKARIKAYHKTWRDKPENKARTKAYHKTYWLRPEVNARAQARQSTPEYRARQKLWRRTNKAQASKKARESTPEYKAQHAARERMRRLTPKHKASYLTPEYRARSIASHSRIPIEIPNRPRPDRCECCGEIPTTKHPLHFDHCHDTGRFRGWCCAGCNNGTGIADNPKRLRLRALYLERPLQPGPINWAYPKGWRERGAA
jgi:hypothetical protein